MRISMRLSGAATSAQGTLRTVTLTEAPFWIGRSPGDDGWTLQDDENMISRRHCMLALTDDGVALTDHSSHGTAVGAMEARLQPGQPTLLAETTAIYLAGRARIDISFGGAVATINERNDTIWDDEPQTRGPAVMPQPKARPSGDVGGDRRAPPPPPFAPPPPPARPNAGRTIPVPPDAQGRMAPPPGPIKPPPPPGGMGSPQAPREAPAAPVMPRPPLAPEPPVDPAPAPAPQSPPPAADLRSALAAVCAAMGVDPASLCAETPEDALREIGESHRAMAESLRLLLLDRRDVKISFNLTGTHFERGGNPLKTAYDSSDAVAAILGRRHDNFPDAVSVVDDARRDLQAHQSALLQAVKAAIKVALRAFDPLALERKMNDRSLLRHLPGMRKAALWGVFEEHYQRFADEANDDFVRMLQTELDALYGEITATRR